MSDDRVTFTVRLAVPATVTADALTAALLASRKLAPFYVSVLSDSDLDAEADRIRRRAYWDDVRGIVKDAEDAILAGEIADREALSDWLHETIDGCGRVIYTAQAMEGLCFSDNDGAYFENYGAEGAVEDGCIQWSRLMYAALEADVNETIDAEILNADGFCQTCRAAGTITPTASTDDLCDDCAAKADADEGGAA